MVNLDSDPNQPQPQAALRDHYEALSGVYVHFAAGGGAANHVAMDASAFDEFLAACGLAAEDGHTHEAVYAAVCLPAADGASPFVYRPNGMAP